MLFSSHKTLALSTTSRHRFFHINFPLFPRNQTREKPTFHARTESTIRTSSQTVYSSYDDCLFHHPAPSSVHINLFKNCRAHRGNTYPDHGAVIWDLVHHEDLDSLLERQKKRKHHLDKVYNGKDAKCTWQPDDIPLTAWPQSEENTRHWYCDQRARQCLRLAWSWLVKDCKQPMGSFRFWTGRQWWWLACCLYTWVNVHHWRADCVLKKKHWAVTGCWKVHRRCSTRAGIRDVECWSHKLFWRAEKLRSSRVLLGVLKYIGYELLQENQLWDNCDSPPTFQRYAVEFVRHIGFLIFPRRAYWYLQSTGFSRITLAAMRDAWVRNMAFSVFLSI